MTKNPSIIFLALVGLVLVGTLVTTSNHSDRTNLLGQILIDNGLEKLRPSLEVRANESQPLSIFSGGQSNLLPCESDCSVVCGPGTHRTTRNEITLCVAD